MCSLLSSAVASANTVSHSSKTMAGDLGALPLSTSLLNI